MEFYFLDKLFTYSKNITFKNFNPFKIYFISPEKIKYITPPSDLVDFTQFGRNKAHPHAGIDRGFFQEENRIGTVVSGDWDFPRISFDNLIEYKSLNDYLTGKCDWNETEFAQRAIQYIESGFSTKNYKTVQEYVEGRKLEIDHLVESINKDGVKRVSKHYFSKNFIDEISINISRDGKFMFNNRGHHRVSIAKILGIDLIPVAIIVRHTNWVEKHGFNVENKL